MPLSKPQRTIFDDPNRFRLAVCGRRFGKTHLSKWEIARAARFPNRRILYLAPNYRQAKSIIWQDLKDELGDRRWIKKINESELSIRLVNNTLIELRSAESADSIRGISCDFVVLDECAYMPSEVFSQVIRPTLSDTGGGALFITTPISQSNWVYDLYMQCDHLEDWSSYQYTTLDGGNVPELEIEAAKRDLDLKTFQAEYLADFTSGSRLVYYAFDKKNNIKPFTDRPNQIWIGADFNIEPMSAVVGTPTKEGFHIFDEIIIQNSNTHELAEEITRRYGGHRITVFPDPAGSARKTASRGRSDHDILREYGLEVKSKRAHPKVKDRNAVVNSMLLNAQGESRLFFDPKCKTTIDSVSRHSYKMNTMIPDKDSGTDHATDCLAYVVDYNYAIRDTRDTFNKPKVFGAF
jgi:hypothetical protein